MGKTSRTTRSRSRRAQSGKADANRNQQHAAERPEAIVGETHERSAQPDGKAQRIESRRKRPAPVGQDRRRTLRAHRADHQKQHAHRRNRGKHPAQHPGGPALLAAIRHGERGDEPGDDKDAGITGKDNQWRCRNAHRDPLRHRPRAGRDEERRGRGGDQHVDRVRLGFDRVRDQLRRARHEDQRDRGGHGSQRARNRHEHDEGEARCHERGQPHHPRLSPIVIAIHRSSHRKSGGAAS